MVDCAYCEHPLICDRCETSYTPLTPEHYEALSRPELTIECTECGEVLVCHWCKTAYDGNEDESNDRASTRVS